MGSIEEIARTRLMPDAILGSLVIPCAKVAFCIQSDDLRVFLCLWSGVVSMMSLYMPLAYVALRDGVFGTSVYYANGTPLHMTRIPQCLSDVYIST